MSCFRRPKKHLAIYLLAASLAAGMVALAEWIELEESAVADPFSRLGETATPSENRIRRFFSEKAERVGESASQVVDRVGETEPVDYDPREGYVLDQKDEDPRCAELRKLLADKDAFTKAMSSTILDSDRSNRQSLNKDERNFVANDLYEIATKGGDIGIALANRHLNGPGTHYAYPGSVGDGPSAPRRLGMDGRNGVIYGNPSLPNYGAGASDGNELPNHSSIVLAGEMAHSFAGMYDPYVTHLVENPMRALYGDEAQRTSYSTVPLGGSIDSSHPYYERLKQYNHDDAKLAADKVRLENFLKKWGCK